jgi:diguanylate cyclase (GGDEF)-like protein/PAS domain S-box-containing protein
MDGMDYVAMSGMLFAIFFAALSAIFVLGLLFSRHQIHIAQLAASASKAFECVPLPLLRMEVDGEIGRANNALKALLGIDGNLPNLRNLLHPSDLDTFEVLLQQFHLGYGKDAAREMRLRHSDGHLIWVDINIAPQRETPGKIIFYLIAVIDIVEKKRNELFFRCEEEKLKAMLEQLPVAVWMLSPGGDLTFVNSAYESLFGCAEEQIYADARGLGQVIHPQDIERVVQVKNRRDGHGSYEVNYRVLRDDGDIRYIREQGNGVYGESGKQIYEICAATDISGEMIARDELHELNSRLRETNLRLRESVRLDSLTSCLNRSALLDEADKSLQLEQRHRRSSALVFFDLNNFKTVNDNFGHHVGDRCLIAFAEQIKARLRTTDELGRYGGDEFVALLRETDAEQARKLLSTLVPIVIDDGRGSSIILRFSAGVACSNDADIRSVDDWLRVADLQMYQQKPVYAPYRI